jgi:hypothetical protein
VCWGGGENGKGEVSTTRDLWDGARDVRVFGSYFAGCLVLVSYWYSWIRNLGLWVWVGVGGGVRGT